MATMLDHDFEITDWTVPSIVELLKESQKLSENIYLTEIEELGVEVTKVAGADNGDELAAFDPESWLKSLTLTQLAELHDKICLLTSNMVQQDSGPAAYDRLAINWDYGDPLQADYDALNRRIAALQKQIVEKQIEAGWKLQELRRALRLEQANLIRISDRMNLERRRNLALHLTMDDSA
ncbi:major antigen-like protein [Lasius niger]|uniref:Major antigen-like protein n=1 Tax=Lasius niger TaxID=67767 RepID=A0A0J7L4E6_LASNI|nr:major antigen-like protein [Lasius niger]